MEFRLYGVKDRCVWCAGPIKGDPKTSTFLDGNKVYEVILCSESCRQELKNAEQKYKGKARYFLAALVAFLVLSALGLLGLFLSYNLLYLAPLGTLIMGFTILKLPFVTPQTVRMTGYRKGFRIGRMAGWLLLLAGFVTAILIFAYAP